MKITTIALTIALTADSASAFQPVRFLHRSSNLHSSPFAQIAQMFTEKPRVNDSVANGAAISAEAGGPGCIRKSGFDEDDGKVTFANRAELHESLGLAFDIDEGGPGCIRKAGFDEDDGKVTYANRAAIHAFLGIQEGAGDGPGCVRKAGYDEEEAKIIYRNQADLHARIGVKAETAVNKSPTKADDAELLRPVAAAVKPAQQKEAAPAEETPTSPNERVYGVVNTSRLNKLYDIVVIGGGPAGVAGAIKAAQMGRRAILIDKVCI
jgi:hypothetical protein